MPLPTSTPEPSNLPPVEETIATSGFEQKAESLVTRLDGYPVTIDYYAQFLDSNDEPRAYDDTLSPVLQSYHRVIGFELMLDSGLSFQYLKNVQAKELTGTGKILPCTITPNVGDVILLPTGNGQRTVFNITEVTPLSHFNETGWEISFNSEYILTPVILDGLNAKSVKTSYFKKDLLEIGKDPIISSESANRLDDLSAWREIILDWLAEFVNRPKQCMPLPGITPLIIDRHHWTALRRVVNTTTWTQYHHVTAYEYLDRKDYKTVWDTLLDLVGNRTSYPLSRVESSLGVLGKNASTDAKRNLRSMYYSDVSYGVGISSQTLHGRLTPHAYPTVVDVRPNIHSVTIDEHYVFSQAFYEDDITNMSLLEISLHQYLTNQAINPQSVLTLCEDAGNWEKIDQFYYIVPLVLLIDRVLREG